MHAQLPFQLASADKILQVLLIFDNGLPVRVTDASRELGVSRSSAHRLLATLESRGFVRQDAATRAYLPGEALVRLSRSLGRDTSLERAAQDEIEKLAGRLRESVHVAVLDGAKVGFVVWADGLEEPRTGSRIGTSFPAHTTASGKVLLSELPIRSLRALYAIEAFEPKADCGISSWSSLLTVLDDVRLRGYASNLQESERGINAVAVPIKDNAGAVYGALTVIGPAFRFKRHKFAAYAVEMTATAHRIALTMAAIERERRTVARFA
jgi:DNA-binding IclR family transcriptional regulator